MLRESRKYCARWNQIESETQVLDVLSNIYVDLKLGKYNIIEEDVQMEVSFDPIMYVSYYVNVES